MPYEMFIDDKREFDREKYDFHEGEVVMRVKDSSTAIWYMDTYGCPVYISFDHDLGEGDDAMTIVNHMIKKDLDSGGTWIPERFQFNVHSANPVGAENIRAKLSRYLEERAK